MIQANKSKRSLITQDKYLKIRSLMIRVYQYVTLYNFWLINSKTKTYQANTSVPRGMTARYHSYLHTRMHLTLETIIVFALTVKKRFTASMVFGGAKRRSVTSTTAA